MKKKTIFLSIFIVLIAGFTFLYFYGADKRLSPNNVTGISKDQSKKSAIKKHYNSYVKVNKKAIVYCKQGNKYKDCGKIGKNMEVTLESLGKIDEDYPYFQIKDTSLYLYYKDVSKIDTLTKTNIDYKSYVPFDENIVMDKTILYTEEGLALEINEPLNLPILIDDGDKKYIDYHNRLYYVKKEDIKEIVKTNRNEIYASQMAVLNYHFFYDDKTGGCNEIICLKTSKFEEQIKYLNENSYYTPTMKEFEMFMDKKIRLPKKSVFITVDDGAMGTDNILPAILEKYHKKGSLFLITGWNDKSKFTSDSVELHSHTDAMHSPGVCPGGQGGGIKCLPEEKVLADLKKTRELLNNTTAFAYPFYEYNDRAIVLLKKAGFTMGFIGGNKKAVPGTNKMLIPRYPILSDITMKEFINKIS